MTTKEFTGRLAIALIVGLLVAGPWWLCPVLGLNCNEPAPGPIPEPIEELLNYDELDSLTDNRDEKCSVEGNVNKGNCLKLAKQYCLEKHRYQRVILIETRADNVHLICDS